MKMKSSDRRSLIDAVGNTPLLKLHHVVPKNSADVFIKYEASNPTGSHKDRMAVAVLQAALESGHLQRGGRVVEYTGGSTGTAIAFVASILGFRFTAVSSDAFSPSKIQAMRAFGAEVILEKSVDGKITAELFQRMRVRALALANEPGSYYFDQFGSKDVRRGYEAIGLEIAQTFDGKINAMCAAVGTAGSLMGTVAGLAKAGQFPDVYVLEPKQSALLTSGASGAHLIEGIALGFIPPSLDLSKVKECRAIDQTLAFDMCRRMAREEGILAGGSTGINVVGALQIAQEIGSGGTVITLACDSGFKYLGGRIYG